MTTNTQTTASDTALEIVVINLERSIERREHMRHQLDPLGLPYSFFPAVDGKLGHPLIDQHYSQKAAESRYGWPLSPGELGCYASHYLAWEKCVKDQRPLLILEDDAILKAEFPEAIELVRREIATCGLLRLSAHFMEPFTLWRQMGEEWRIVRFNKGPVGASAYVITPRAAKLLIKSAEVWFEPCDCLIDRFWTHGLQSLALMPLAVDHAEGHGGSDIWEGRAYTKKSRRYRFRRKFYKKLNKVKRQIFLFFNSSRNLR